MTHCQSPLKSKNLTSRLYRVCPCLAFHIHQLAVPKPPYPPPYCLFTLRSAATKGGRAKAGPPSGTLPKEGLPSVPLAKEGRGFEAIRPYSRLFGPFAHKKIRGFFPSLLRETIGKSVEKRQKNHAKLLKKYAFYAARETAENDNDFPTEN